MPLGKDNGDGTIQYKAGEYYDPYLDEEDATRFRWLAKQQGKAFIVGDDPDQLREFVDKQMEQEETAWLTDEEIIETLKQGNIEPNFSHRYVARIIMNKIKEKNGG